MLPRRYLEKNGFIYGDDGEDIYKFTDWEDALRWLCKDDGRELIGKSEAERRNYYGYYEYKRRER